MLPASVPTANAVTAPEPSGDAEEQLHARSCPANSRRPKRRNGSVMYGAIVAMTAAVTASAAGGNVGGPSVLNIAVNTLLASSVTITATTKQAASASALAPSTSSASTRPLAEDREAQEGERPRQGQPEEDQPDHLERGWELDEHVRLGGIEVGADVGEHREDDQEHQ